MFVDDKSAELGRLLWLQSPPIVHRHNTVGSNIKMEGTHPTPSFSVPWTPISNVQGICDRSIRSTAGIGQLGEACSLGRPETDSVFPVPYLPEKSGHRDLLALHLNHPGMFQHPPWCRATWGLLF